MTAEEKIALLINAQTKENNYIAIRLMINVLDYSFKEAFLKLKHYKASNQLLYLEIATIKIEYVVSFYQQIDVPSDWGDIKRKVYDQEKLLINSFQQYDLDEAYIWSLSDLDAIETLEEIHIDLEKLSPKIEKLFFDEYTLHGFDF